MRRNKRLPYILARDYTAGCCFYKKIHCREYDWHKHTCNHTHTLTNTQGTKTSQYIYREEGSSIKRTLKISVWLSLDHRSLTILSIGRQILERSLVSPGQLKMSSIFPVTFSTAHLESTLDKTNTKSLKYIYNVTQEHNVNMQASIKRPNTYPHAALRTALCCHIYRRESPCAGWM